jgi:hypothetical protein
MHEADLGTGYKAHLRLTTTPSSLLCFGCQPLAAAVALGPARWRGGTLATSG